MAHSMVLARKRYLHGETAVEVDEVVTVVVADCSTEVLGVGTILFLMLPLMEGGGVPAEVYKKKLQYND